jgi:16S rRNA (guanine1207-N2)-methyltransferase
MAAHSRLQTALDDGLLTLPEGAVTIWRPDATYDVGALSGRDVSISQSFFPDYAVWTQAGYETAARLIAAPTVVVVVPRSKALARAMIAAAARVASLVVVDGYKTDGVDSLFKACRKKRGSLPSMTKDHGRLFWMTGGDDFADWAAPAPAENETGFVTTAGVFSEGAIDAGSALLVDALPDKIKGRVADFGAGWGFLSRAILKRPEVTSLDLIEAEALALDCARLNVIDARARFFWQDASSYQPEQPYDAVIMNPPFHTGRAGDPSLGQAFINNAARALAPNGKLWMVANRHLPYESVLKDRFRNVDELTGNGAFKIFHATRPIR